MNDLRLVTTEHFEGIPFKCYQRTEDFDSSDFWATREQIGQLLGYPDPRRAIAKIHTRHQARLNRFSRVDILSTLEGGRNVAREVTVYNFKGLLEICRYSNQPKADEVMDFLWNIADEIRKTGSYSMEKKPQTLETVLPAHSGSIKAAERILRKVFKCKADEDFQEVLALDDAFKASFGVSVLKTLGIKLIRRRIVYRFPDGKGGFGDYMTDEFSTRWEHPYNLNLLANRD